MTIAVLVVLYLLVATYLWATNLRVEFVRRDPFASALYRLVVFLLSPFVSLGALIDTVYRPAQRVLGRESTKSIEHAVIRRLYHCQPKGYEKVIEDMVRETDSADIDRVAKALREVLWNEPRHTAVAALLSVTSDVLGGNTSVDEQVLLPKLARAYGEKLADVSRIFLLRRLDQERISQR